jgi:hypothetical protein
MRLRSELSERVVTKKYLRHPLQSVGLLIEGRSGALVFLLTCRVTGRPPVHSVDLHLVEAGGLLDQRGPCAALLHHRHQGGEAGLGRW